MKQIILFILFIIFFNIVKSNQCNCILNEYCKPLGVGERTEFIGFSDNSTGNYLNYDYYSITTIGVYYDANISIPKEFVCISHANGVRLVWWAKIPNQQLSNETFRNQFIDKIIESIQKENMDGVIYELDDPNSLTSENSDFFTEIIEKTFKILKPINWNYQISSKLPFSPNIDLNYNYLGISYFVDYLVVMDYNIGSRVTRDGNCLAGSNSPNPMIEQGIKNFTSMGIPGERMVLTYPWFGLDFICVNGSLSSEDCFVEKDEDDNCNDIKTIANQISYGEIIKILNDNNITNGGINWNSNSKSVFFNYYDYQGILHQIHFDNPKSLFIKVFLTKRLRAKGIAAQTMDNLDFTDLVNSYNMYDTMAYFFM
ncbi:hypothetical protein RB653_002718 [Dictyostelium firmibasis]|uniref:GH18 domain-containing protein n=1 Tax=Dictyostelium firmibasis TaxID=79012 RepID=A0AAN7U3E6_9MYCE